MYSRFWEDDPHIKKTRAESEARGKALGEIEGEARGEIKGEMRTLQKMIFTVIQTRFPDLMEMAQQRVPRIHDLPALNSLAEQIVATDDAITVRRLLCPPTD